MSVKRRQVQGAKPARSVARHLHAKTDWYHADAVIMQGTALLDAGRPQDAAVLLNAAHKRDPNNVPMLILNCRALIESGQIGLAIGGLLLAADLQPGNARVHFSLGILLHNSGNPELALVHSLKAFQLAPRDLDATPLSAVLIALGHYAEALAVAKHVLVIQPNRWEALLNASIALQGLHQFEDAVTIARQTVAASPPSNAASRFNLSVKLLALGELTAEAWDLFEWRLLLDGNPARLLATAALRWQGEDIASRTILLQAEQGFGDTLQFVRYAPLVAERAGRVILEVQPALARLMRQVPGVDQVVAVGDALPHFDVVCPLQSLPRIFATTLDTIPPALPYADAFGPSHDADMQVLRVGLVWAGSKTNKDDRHRSLSMADMASLSKIPGVQLYSLQRHEPGRAELPSDLDAIDLMAGIEDFRDTAALVAELDLVISVDTAVAHLAATMGKPVWLLSRWNGCWRWMHHRADSPWYPNIRIFRQAQPNDWSGVLEQVREGLVALTRVLRS